MCWWGLLWPPVLVMKGELGVDVALILIKLNLVTLVLVNSYLIQKWQQPCKGVKMKVVIIDRFYNYIVLFCVLEQTHCALVTVVILNEWLYPFTTFFKIHHSGGLTQVTALFGCNMAGAVWNCCRLGAHLVTPYVWPCASLQCHFIQSHICRVQVCFSCNLPPALSAKWPGSFACCCSSTGVEWIPK